MGRVLDARTDIYSLAVVLRELLTHQRWFSGDDVAGTLRRIVEEVPPPARSLNPEIPEGVDAALTRALAKNPADRFQTAQEFVRALRSGFGFTVPAEADLPETGWAFQSNRVSEDMPRPVGALTTLEVDAFASPASSSSTVSAFRSPVAPAVTASRPALGAAVAIGLGLLLLASSTRTALVMLAVGAALLVWRSITKGDQPVTLRANDSSAVTGDALVKPSASALDREPEPGGDTATGAMFSGAGMAGRRTVRREAPVDATEAFFPYRGPHAAGLALTDPGAGSWLVALNGAQAGQQFNLRDVATIGRSTASDVYLPDSHISRLHTEIVWKEGRFWVRDLESSNGTMVNGVLLRSGQECALTDRDEIQVGRTRLVFITTADIESRSVESSRRLNEFEKLWNELTRAAHND
jgi:hypothetical protein